MKATPKPAMKKPAMPFEPKGKGGKPMPFEPKGKGGKPMPFKKGGKGC
jgi:hypothetical protein